MRKEYIYSFEEEKQINEKLGYIQKDYDNFRGNFYEHNRYYEQYQWTIDLNFVKKAIYYLFRSKCPDCNVKLEKIKQLKYVGFRHKAGATAGNYHKAYEVTTYRECPKCQKKILNIG